MSRPICHKLLFLKLIQCRFLLLIFVEILRQIDLNFLNSLYLLHQILSFLYNQLIELAEMLKLHLRNFVDVVVEKLKSINIIDEYIDLSQVRDVVTLNYTHTFESIYCKEIKRNIYHLLTAKNVYRLSSL